jgi:hypothetical protein
MNRAVLATALGIAAAAMATAACREAPPTPHAADEQRNLIEAGAGPRPWRTLSRSELTRLPAHGLGALWGTAYAYDPFVSVNYRRWILLRSAGIRQSLVLIGVNKDGDGALVVEPSRASASGLSFTLVLARTPASIVDNAVVSVDVENRFPASVRLQQKTTGAPRVQVAPGRTAYLLSPGVGAIYNEEGEDPNAMPFDVAVTCGRRIVEVSLRQSKTIVSSFVFDLRRAPFERLSLVSQARCSA